MKSIGGIIVLLWVLGIIGEIVCIVRFVSCDFKEPYKAEIIYGVSAVSGIGAVVGYINIEDK